MEHPEEKKIIIELKIFIKINFSILIQEFYNHSNILY
jgi:hypothetical protein